MAKTLLMTGGAGFIGSAVVRAAITRGDRVINFDALTYAGNLANLGALRDHPNHTFIHADIRDMAAVSRAFVEHQPDAVMHLAAESHVDRSIDGPRGFIETNIIGTFNLLEAARTVPGLRFHHVSTDEVYGDLSPDDPAFTETTPYAPSSPYSASKAGSDHLVRAWARTYDLDCVITNCSNNYGPYQYPEKLIPVIILKALHGQNIPVYGTGENIRDWLHVEDHAEALLTVMDRGVSGETYNIGGNSERTNLQVVEGVCRALESATGQTGLTDLITFVADRPGHDHRYAIDDSKIEQTLGWRPARSFEDGLKETVQWYLDHEEWWRPLTAADQYGQRLGQKG